MSIGACYYLAKNNSRSFENIYLGQKLFKKNQNILREIKKIFPSKKYIVQDKVKSKKIAKLLKKDAIIAIANGKEEFGSRALGNRSIIANPSKPETIKIINEMIKNRDFWMPFALTILERKHKNFLINKKNISCEFMTIGFDTIKNKIDLIKAGTHPYDNTVRPQILSRNKNVEYYEIIDNFYKITGIPAVLNTSLNLHGFPISSKIEDVANTFKHSGLKYLFLINKILVIKK